MAGEPAATELPCRLCGLPTKLPPFCIECDMSGRSRRDGRLCFGVTGIDRDPLAKEWSGR